jgi:hypothetical protein
LLSGQRWLPARLRVWEFCYLRCRWPLRWAVRAVFSGVAFSMVAGIRLLRLMLLSRIASLGAVRPKSILNSRSGHPGEMQRGIRRRAGCPRVSGRGPGMVQAMGRRGRRM